MLVYDTRTKTFTLERLDICGNLQKEKLKETAVSTRFVGGLTESNEGLL